MMLLVSGLSPDLESVKRVSRRQAANTVPRLPSNKVSGSHSLSAIVSLELLASKAYLARSAVVVAPASASRLEVTSLSSSQACMRAGANAGHEEAWKQVAK